MVQYVFFKLVYGGYISDSYDQQTVNAMVDYWISPPAVKKDFELAKSKFRDS